MNVRLEPSLLAHLDAWIERQSEGYSRAQAIRAILTDRLGPEASLYVRLLRHKGRTEAFHEAWKMIADYAERGDWKGLVEWMQGVLSELQEDEALLLSDLRAEQAP